MRNLGCCRRSSAQVVAMLISVLLIGSGAGRSASAEDSLAKLVVVLYPQNNDGSPGNFIVDQGIRAVFAENASDHVEIHNEYLDITSPTSGRDSELQRDYLTRKYAGRSVDVVIVALSSALDLVLKHREIFSGAPVVFCAVDEGEVRARDLPADVIGVPVTFDLVETLNLALRFHPKTTTVAVVSGSAPMDREWERNARVAFQSHEQNLEFRYLCGLSLDDLLTEIAHLPRHSVIYYLHVFNDDTGKTLVPSHVLKTIAKNSHVPVYGHVDTYVGRGIVGGRVFSFEQEGRNAGGLALRIIAGETPEVIGVQDINASSYMFDDRQLKKWGITEAKLPVGSIVRDRQPDFWESYRQWILLAGLIFCLQTLLIVGLLIQRSLRRRAEERMRTSQRELQQLSNSLIGAQENERRRIARELHDDFNQRLALLSVELDLVSQKPPDSDDEVRKRMQVLSNHVRELSTSIHDLSHELHPLKLEQLGLVTAVRALCQEVARSHDLDVQFQHKNLPEAIPAEIALCLYRIAQEALRNVIKHSQSDVAFVDLDANATEIHLKVADQGVGLSPGSSGRGGLGLISIRERLRQVHGRYSINSQPTSGTCLEVRVPLSTTAKRTREPDGNLVAVP